MLKIWADFNSMTPDRKRVAIFNKDVIEKLQPGLHVILYEPDEFEVEAVIEVEKDEEGNDWWYGVIDWNTSRDLPHSKEN